MPAPKASNCKVVDEKPAPKASNCKVVDEKPAPKAFNYASLGMPVVQRSPEEKSVVSSESGDEKHDNPFGDPPSPATEQVSGKKRKNRRGLNTDPFAAKKLAEPSPSTPSNKKQKNQTKEAQLSKNESKQAQPSKSPHSSAPQNEPKQSQPTNPPHSSTHRERIVKRATFPPQVETVVDFRSLNLPIADFALASASDHAKGAESSSECDGDEVEAKPEPVESERYPLPKSTDAGRKWLDAVKKSQENPKFSTHFDFAKSIEKDALVGGKIAWVQAKAFGDWCRSNPQAIAIDCEMCETQDPVSKEKNPMALCRVSIVDAETDEILLNTLVKPDWPVTDYRTRINGISQSDLAPVEFTLRHCQAFLLALCSEETVILGHAVHHDLNAMRMEHYCVADSSLLFPVKDRENALVSLKDLCFSVLGKEMPKTHDSVNDARAALCCLEHYIEKGGNVEPISRTQPRKVPGTDPATGPSAAAKLFIHRIPKYVTVKHLENMFLSTTKVATESVDEIDFGAGMTGKTLATFSTPHHATLAFNGLKGNFDEDPSGRLQKKVFLRGGGDYIRIRKMVHERGGHRNDRSKTPEKRKVV